MRRQANGEEAGGVKAGASAPGCGDGGPDGEGGTVGAGQLVTISA